MRAAVERSIREIGIQSNTAGTAVNTTASRRKFNNSPHMGSLLAIGRKYCMDLGDQQVQSRLIRCTAARQSDLVAAGFACRRCRDCTNEYERASADCLECGHMLA